MGTRRKGGPVHQDCVGESVRGYRSWGWKGTGGAKSGEGFLSSRWKGESGEVRGKWGWGAGLRPCGQRKIMQMGWGMGAGGGGGGSQKSSNSGLANKKQSMGSNQELGVFRGKPEGSNMWRSGRKR